jgi:hypothetical protein
MVPMTRSQWAFAFGDKSGVRMASLPMDAAAASTSSQKIESLS